MSTRNWSIRSKIIALLLVPLITLVVLWGFATSLTVPPALNLLNAETNAEFAAQPGEALVNALQRERMLSVVYLGGKEQTPALGDQRQQTDRVAATFRERVTSEELQDAASDLTRRRIAEVIGALDILPSGRGFIDRREMDRSGALGLFNGVVDAVYRLFSALAALDDTDLARDSRTLIALARAHEVLSQENALVAGAFAAGRFGEGEPSQIIQLIGTQRFLYTEAIAELPDAERVAYQKLTEGQAFVDLRAMEDRLIAQAEVGGDMPIESGLWQTSYESVSAAVRQFEQDQSAKVADKARPAAIATFVRLGLVSVLGLLAIIVTVVVSARVGRSLIGRIRRLRQAALELAGLRLPLVVAKLRRGEKVDVAEHAPPLEYGTDEIGQLGRAFTEVQQTAVQSAVDQAELRKGLSEVFLNIARRSQSLLHRQLALLDKMERRTTEPDELDDLFKVDHLATRMRRHAEDLVILAGATPGRGWRNPVPMIDVIRGAVSEVEDYARVNVMMIEDAAVIGRSVGDVIHLLAELIENAASFSPPHTRVHVAGQLLPNGYAVEIEDRGLGMSPEAIASANERLATPPDFDPANSARLGLFVVAQLAARHGVRVELRKSPYGGVTAVALLPNDLIVASESGPPQPPSVGQQSVSAAPPGRAPALLGPPAPEPEEGPAAVPIQLDRRMRTISRLTRTGTRPAIASSRDAQPETVTGEPVVTRPAGRDQPLSAAGPNQPLSAAGPNQPLSAAGPKRARTLADPMPPTPPVLLSEDGLPKRVRQTNLVRQLRESPSPVEPEPTANGGDARSPDEIRAMMSSFQSGTRRGRRDSNDPLPAPRTPVSGNAPDDEVTEAWFPPPPGAAASSVAPPAHPEPEEET